MLKNIFFLTSLLIISITAAASEIVLSEKAKISLITCEVGDEIYSLFGHSAIRVYDPKRGLDIMFNYGTFDFDTEDFFFKFAKGTLNYKLSTRGYESFIEDYQYFNRSIEEQVLQLDSVDMQLVFDFLVENRKPENRYYLYDYYYNNCSSKIRDVFQDVLKDKLYFDFSYGKDSLTIRQLMHSHLKPHPWTKLSLDVLLGAPIDIKASPSEYMYLPKYLQEGFKGASVNNRPFALPTEVLFKSNREVAQHGFLTPNRVFWLAFIIMLTLTYIQYHKKNYTIDSIILIFFGLLGCLLMWISYGTAHKAAANNLDLLWALPTHLIFGLLLLKKRKPKYLKFYFLAISIWMVFLLMIWPFTPDLNNYLLPIVMIIGMRSFRIYDNENRQHLKSYYRS